MADKLTDLLHGKIEEMIGGLSEENIEELTA